MVYRRPRDRLGQLEELFFATVLFGSDILFLAMLFVAAAAFVGGILTAFAAQPDEVADSATFQSNRRCTRR